MNRIKGELANKYFFYQPKTKLISSLKNSKKSYSQTGEDIIIKTALAELGISKPSYLDIGAHHPFYLNNTALFYKQGSRGVNVEPDPELFKKFERFRKNDTNLNMGIAEESGTLKLHIMSSTTLNTFSEKEAKQYEKLGYPIKKTVNIKVANINTIIKKYFGNKAPNLLSVDVEGLDYKILKSLDFKKYSPEIICAETIEFSKDGTGNKDDRIPKLLASNGYIVYADTKINTIFIKADREKQ